MVKKIVGKASFYFTYPMFTRQKIQYKFASGIEQHQVFAARPSVGPRPTGVLFQPIVIVAQTVGAAIKTTHTPIFRNGKIAAQLHRLIDAVIDLIGSIPLDYCDK